jgi:hypothetical protein
LIEIRLRSKISGFYILANPYTVGHTPTFAGIFLRIEILARAWISIRISIVLPGKRSNAEIAGDK